MIFILGSFILGASLIKIYFRKYKKNEYILDIDELIKEYEIINIPSKINNSKNDRENDNNYDNKNNIIDQETNDIEKYDISFNVPVITIEHLNKIDENIENKIKDLENSLGISLKLDNFNNKEYLPNNITPEVRIFHTIMKKGNLYNDEYKRTINDFVVTEFVRLAHELNINLNESINDENFDIMYAKYVEELIRKKLE
jgi:hypothetical protein